MSAWIGAFRLPKGQNLRRRTSPPVVYSAGRFSNPSTSAAGLSRDNDQIRFVVNRVHDGQALAGKIRSAWDGILEDAGLGDDVVRYSLRHTAATRRPLVVLDPIFDRKRATSSYVQYVRVQTTAMPQIFGYQRPFGRTVRLMI
jgi:hypothetical protein